MRWNDGVRVDHTRAPAVVPANAGTHLLLLTASGPSWEMDSSVRWNDGPERITRQDSLSVVPANAGTHLALAASTTALTAHGFQRALE